MFGWLEKRTSASMRDDADRFLVSLKGADQMALDTVAATAAYWASYYASKGRDLYSMESWLLSHKLFPVELVSSIKTLQKSGSASSAPGLMVWLHSARALLYPDLRLGGRNIWSELAKASPDAQGLADELAAATGRFLIVCHVSQVPSGLEPLDR